MNVAPFHAGERELQDRAGVKERMDSVGRIVIRDHMLDQHREFFGQLQTLLLGIQDALGQPWASILHGPVGFLSSPDARTLRVHARPFADDPVAQWLVEGSTIGLLGLQAHTRRRNRLNGTVTALHADGFDVTVRQSFGNCPKYIYARQADEVPQKRSAPALKLGATLCSAAINLLRRADTFFIASASGNHPGTHPSDGVDISHKGGRPGFIRVQELDIGIRLTVPDYVGNFYFNTLGNLLQWPNAGLLVPDFNDGSLLQLAGKATIDHDSPDAHKFPGAQRLLHLDVLEGCWRPRALPFNWSSAKAPAQFDIEVREHSD
jgi:predicted pyridoxine 5'-phosphate oxidase superfamily flavin-nucleotide-binding protein